MRWWWLMTLKDPGVSLVDVLFWLLVMCWRCGFFFTCVCMCVCVFVCLCVYVYVVCDCGCLLFYLYVLYSILIYFPSILLFIFFYYLIIIILIHISLLQLYNPYTNLTSPKNKRITVYQRRRSLTTTHVLIIHTHAIYWIKGEARYYIVLTEPLLGREGKHSCPIAVGM